MTLSYSLKVGDALRFHWHSAALVRGKPTDYARTVKAASRIQFCVGARTVLRTGRILTPLGGNCREPCECSRGNILASDRYGVPGFREETHVYLGKTRVSGGLIDGAAR
jgi:hypothetical protein